VSNAPELRDAGPRRIVVQGASGSGKSTFARELARILDVPYLELDSIYHQENWSALDVDTFRELVDVFSQQSHWVSDGNYSSVRDFLWPRADTILFLDLPRRHVITRLLRRTIRRGVTHEELWNGNRESLRNLVSWDPERNVVLWSWRTHGRYRESVPNEARLRASHAEVTMLRSSAAVASYLQRFRRV
jgi:adenylate kinase family enzyme